MNQTYPLGEKIKQIFILIIPILITQLGMYSMVFFNTIMSGNYGASALAGVSIGSYIWSPVFTGLSGILLAVSPIATQLLGEKKNRDVSSVVTHGIYLAFMIGTGVIIAGYFLLDPILDIMDLPTIVQSTAHDYLVGLSYGIIPLFMFNALRSFIYALERTRAVMVILMINLPINFLLNYMLIFGKWGFPELGGAGGGYATAITYWFIMGLTVFILKTQEAFSSYFALSHFKRFSWDRCMEIIKIGVPMGLSIFFETSMFAVVTILISQFDITTIASYQTALNIVNILYMIPYSISMAQTVLVGYMVGAKQYDDAKTYSWLGIGLSLMSALLTGLFVVLFRYDIAGFYLNEIAVIQLTGHFLIYALFFQISDAMQATTLGALRGYKDVNVSFVMTLIAYWLICLPLGYCLAHFTELGPSGYWIGLTVGLLVAGICLLFRLIQIQKKYKQSTRALAANQ